MKVLVTAYNRDYFCELSPCGKICDFVARPMDSSWVVGVIFLVRADVNGKDAGWCSGILIRGGGVVQCLSLHVEEGEVRQDCSMTEGFVFGG